MQSTTAILIFFVLATRFFPIQLQTTSFGSFKQKMSARSSFHRNVFLLTQVVPPSKEFQKYFKEGMFDKANTAGFLHVSHYLLTIYDEERFKRAVEWPILDKRGEAKYRNDVKDFLTIVTNENDDIACPSILASYLFTASGTKFMTLMWKLSQIVLRSYLKGTGPVLGAPKPGNAEPLTQLFFNNTIAKHEVRIKEIDMRMKKTENDAREIVKETVKRIETVQSGLFEARKRLSEIAENSNVHADIRKRIINTKDAEVIELWKGNIKLGTDYLRQQIKLVRNIEEKSTKVNNLVMSLFSDARQILDGTNLPRLNVAKLMDLPLEPEAQVALHHSYVDEKLSLNNFLILLNSVLQYFYVNLKRTGFPSLSECKLQIQASTEDLKKMCTVIDQIQNKITNISNELKKTASSNNLNIHSDTLQNHYSDNMFRLLLEASPTIQFNTINNNSERHDVQERLKLTPVEIQHKPLFARYKANQDSGDSFTTPVRPKMGVSRINFDETPLSPSSAKFGAIPKRIASTKTANRSVIETRVPKKYARLFGARSGILANSSMASTSSWRASTFIEEHNGGNIHNLSDIRGNGSIYNMSDLRAQLARTSSDNVSLDLPTPIKFSSQCTNAPPNTLPIKDIEKPAFNSSEVIPDLQTISETTEINIGSTLPTKPANEIGTRINRRLSIGDLVERYKKVRDQSICTPKLNFDIEPNNAF